MFVSVFHGGKYCPPFCATSNFILTISQNLSFSSIFPKNLLPVPPMPIFAPKRTKERRMIYAMPPPPLDLLQLTQSIILVSPLSSPVINRRLVSLSNLLRSRKSSPPWWWSTSSAGLTSTRSGTTSRPTAPSGRGLTEGSKLTTTRNKEMELCFYRKIIFDRKTESQVKDNRQCIPASGNQIL